MNNDAGGGAIPTASQDPFDAFSTLETTAGKVGYYRLQRLAELGIADITRLPYSIKVLLENLLRHCDEYYVSSADVTALAKWSPATSAANAAAISFTPARVLLQDFTGIPAVADLAAMRDATRALNDDPKRINPIVPVDLVIDHSVQVDMFGSKAALSYNVEKEYQRNRERYIFLRWAQGAFKNFRVVPPGAGIVHQVNLEYLASVVQLREAGDQRLAFPDTLVGTDSHTTMVNGLGVLGWGVGGIEAEAVMLGQPFAMLIPEVVGVRLVGELAEGATATDLVLFITQLLRKTGVVNKFVEYYGSGLASLTLSDRATIANMAPEYGATCGFFPVDERTLRYLRETGRPEEHVAFVEQYCRAQGLFHTVESPEPVFTDLLEVDLAKIEPSLAGPRRPQDRVPLTSMATVARESIPTFRPNAEPEFRSAAVELGNGSTTLSDGDVAIAAITSCTNTSNPTVMLAAGLLARNAVRRGLTVKPYVKTSLAPGSQVVEDYLTKANLLESLEKLGFAIAGFGCTTCIGNSGPLPSEVTRAVQENDLVVASVLSGNRNFEGRINPNTKMSFLASPPLVVAYALAGTTMIDFATDPIGTDDRGRPVFLADIWPSTNEIRETLGTAVDSAMYVRRYGQVFEGDEAWRSLPAPEGMLYSWDSDSTYIQQPPFFSDLGPTPAPVRDILNARVLVMVGDSVTTDHISPAGSIQPKGPAGRYLMERGVAPADFNSYGSRRGNHQVMMRGTFANIRLRNLIAPGTEGGVTLHLPDGEEMSIYDASVMYQRDGIPLIVIAGKEYGTGSSRDWAAKGPLLLGVRAVIAESFERIHRSNLVGMGIMPLQFMTGQNAASLGLTGQEQFSIEGLSTDLVPAKIVTVRATRFDGKFLEFPAIARLDSPVEVDYYQNGGILQMVLRKMMAK